VARIAIAISKPTIDRSAHAVKTNIIKTVNVIVATTNETRRSATAEKQRVSCACLSRLAN